MGQAVEEEVLIWRGGSEDAVIGRVMGCRRNKLLPTARRKGHREVMG